MNPPSQLLYCLKLFLMCLVYLSLADEEAKCCEPQFFRRFLAPSPTFLHLRLTLRFSVSLCSAIPSKGKLEEIIDLSSGKWRIFCGERINYLEHVEVRVNLTYSRRGDLLIKLISPQGTVSNLTHYRSADSFFKTTDLDFVLMTLHFWGENAVGLWKLTLENSQPQHTNEGLLSLKQFNLLLIKSLGK